jgi:hypothetical protein
MVNDLTSNPKGYVVMSVLNQEGQNTTNDPTDYNSVISINSTFKSDYPSTYFDVRKYLVNSYNPSLPMDVIDYDNDTPPTSLRATYPAGNTLAQSITASTTVFNVVSTGGNIASNYILEVGSEDMYVTASTNNGGNSYTITVTRGYASSTPTSYSNGQTFTSVDPLHLNATGYATVAQGLANWIKLYETNPNYVVGYAQIASIFQNPPAFGNVNIIMYPSSTPIASSSYWTSDSKGPPPPFQIESAASTGTLPYAWVAPNGHMVFSGYGTGVYNAVGTPNGIPLDPTSTLYIQQGQFNTGVPEFGQ